MRKGRRLLKVNITRICNRIFLELCAAAASGDTELENYYQAGLDLAERLEKENERTDEK